jgi:Na+-translocating ferredoxin:NAD+ oxidoreductase subunit E
VSEGRDGYVPNPVLAGLVGVCPLVAASRSLAEGVVYGLGVGFCAIILGAVIPPLRGLVDDRLQAPVSLALSSALALAYGLCARLYSPTIASGLWIYLPLLAVSGLSLGALRRCSSRDRYGPDGKSRLGGIALEALMFLLTAAFVGALREASGLGVLTLPTPGIRLARIELVGEEPLRLMISPAGGFILLGFIVAAYRAIVRAGGRKAS